MLVLAHVSVCLLRLLISVGVVSANRPLLTQNLRATSSHAFAVKLSRGSNEANGLVLFKRNERWGPVCGTNFDNNDASK